MPDQEANREPLRLGTRNSPLAMAQAHEAKARLCAAHGWGDEQVEIISLVASGDTIQDRALAEIGGKALWTKELDIRLGEGRIDAAVHSMKDVETIRPKELAIAAILPRADRRDCLIGADSIGAIAPGARIGTSAPRRAAQLLGLRPDCEIVMLRGNVATRLAKLERGEADATFLAAAGLDRLGERDLGIRLDLEEWIPAAAQGAIGIECRADDAPTRALLAAIDDSASRAEILAERAFLAAVGGSCHSPIAADARCKGEELELRAGIWSGDGSEKLTACETFARDDFDAIAALGRGLLAEAGPKIAALFEAQG